jgi:signal transduction histidine kinase
VLRPDRPPARTPGLIAADVALAAVLAFLTIGAMRTPEWTDRYGEMPAWAWALGLAPTALVAVRRFAPVTVLALASVAYPIAALEVAEGNVLLAAPFLVYTVAAAHPPSTSRWIALVAAGCGSVVALYGPDATVAYGVPVVAAFYGVGWIIGVRAREAGARAERLAEEAEEARIAGEVAAQEAVAQERARIARELHDAVGHAVNVMVVQAGAARFATDDPTATEALRNIEKVGRAALGDLDAMLGLLQDPGTDAPLEPAHRLADVAQLVEQLRTTGLHVVLDDRCSDEIDDQLEAKLSAAAYRIVQESLTNVVKHAGPASVTVTMRCTPDLVEVSIVDDGRGAATGADRGPSAPGGRGLIGMRERAQVAGGDLEAGPRPGGGYAVTARLPRRHP